MNNFKYMIEGIFINNFYNVFKNEIVIIVLVGFFLSKNINMLKELQNKVVIICGGRVLKFFLNIGVKVDFVCVVDEGEIVYKLVEDNLNCGIFLVFYEGINYRIVKEYIGFKIFYINDKFINNILFMDVRSLGYGGFVVYIFIVLV